MDEKIPMSTSEERQAAIRRIVKLSEVEQRVRRRSNPLPVVFFGVEDCLFLPVLAALLCLIPCAALARFDTVAPLLFLFSPALYTTLHLLTTWKDTVSGVAEWQRSCRLSACTLLALRMLVFGGLAVIVCVPANILLWLTSRRSWSLPWRTFLCNLPLGFMACWLPIGRVRPPSLKCLPPCCSPPLDRSCGRGRTFHALDESYRGLLGYLPQEFGYYPGYTPQQFLRYVAAFRGTQENAAALRRDAPAGGHRPGHAQRSQAANSG